MHTDKQTRQLVTLRINVEVDAHQAEQLQGDKGWSSHDGWQQPQTGLELLAHNVAEASLMAAATDMGQVGARAVWSQIEITDPYDVEPDDIV